MLLQKVAQGSCLDCRKHNVTPLEEKKITELLPMAVVAQDHYPILWAGRTTTGSPVLSGKERTCNCVKTHRFNCENGISTLVFKPSAGKVPVLTLHLLAVLFITCFSPQSKLPEGFDQYLSLLHLSHWVGVFQRWEMHRIIFLSQQKNYNKHKKIS